MSYPSNLRDKDWDLIKPHFATRKYGNRAIHSRRSLVNGILYGVKTGVKGCMLPKNFPPWKTLYGYFRYLSRLGIWEKVLADLVKIKRLQEGCNAHPGLLIIDAQSVKTSGKGEQRGFDGEKKVKRRKRQIVVDTMGKLYQVLVHRSNIHDSKGGAVLADLVLRQQRQVKKVLAELDYRGFFEERVPLMHKRFVEFSTKITGKFVIQAKRCIVERTIAWFSWARRLSKDFGQKCIYSESIICLSAIAFDSQANPLRQVLRVKI